MENISHEMFVIQADNREQRERMVPMLKKALKREGLLDRVMIFFGTEGPRNLFLYAENISKEQRETLQAIENHAVKHARNAEKRDREFERERERLAKEGIILTQKNGVWYYNGYHEDIYWGIEAAKQERKQEEEAYAAEMDFVVNGGRFRHE